jgi:peptidoglycan hydrolase CwlO-like protein
MNKDQYNYDIGVQILNRSNDIKILEAKVERLKKLRDDIYAKGQEDKQRNHRQNTLIVHKTKVNQYDKKIKQTEELSDVLKRRNGLLEVPNDLPRSPPSIKVIPILNVPKTPRKKRFDTPKYPTNLSDMEAVLDTLVQQGDLKHLRPDIQEWILEFYDSELQTLEKINEALSELNKEIESTNKTIKDRSCCI